MKGFRNFLPLWLSGWILVFQAGAALAQSNSAVILGVVNDSSGGAIAGAKVTVANQGTSISTMATTTAEGQYTVTNLEISSSECAWHSDLPGSVCGAGNFARSRPFRSAGPAESGSAA
jgi:hypothetical protein